MIRTLSPDDGRIFESSKYNDFLNKTDLLNDPKKFEEFVRFMLSDLQKDNNLVSSYSKH